MRWLIIGLRRKQNWPVYIYQHQIIFVYHLCSNPLFSNTNPHPSAEMLITRATYFMTVRLKTLILPHCKFIHDKFYIFWLCNKSHYSPVVKLTIKWILIWMSNYCKTCNHNLYTVDTRNSGPWYSGFTCFSEQNCADQLQTYEVNSHLK